MFGEPKAGSLGRLGIANSEGECRVGTKAWRRLLGPSPHRSGHRTEGTSCSPAHITCFCLPSEPHHTAQTSEDPGGSDLRQEEEEEDRGRTSFWQAAPTVESPSTQTIWVSGEPRAFGPLAEQWKGVPSSRGGGSERSNWEAALTTKAELRLEGCWLWPDPPRDGRPHSSGSHRLVGFRPHPKASSASAPAISAPLCLRGAVEGRLSQGTPGAGLCFQI